MTAITKSNIVVCPRCDERLLAEAPIDADAATVICWNCDDRLTVPGTPLTAEEGVL